MLGKMVLGVNGYREICTLHLAGQIMVDKLLVLRLANTAAERSKKMVDKIKKSLAEDEEARKSKAPRGFAAKNRNNSILQNAAPRSRLDLGKLAPLHGFSQKAKEPAPSSTINDDGDVVDVVPEGMEEDESSDSDLEVTDVKTRNQIMEEKTIDKIDLDEDSEEEETIQL